MNKNLLISVALSFLIPNLSSADSSFKQWQSRVTVMDSGFSGMQCSGSIVAFEGFSANHNALVLTNGTVLDEAVNCLVVSLFYQEKVS
jgi:hypothetical protein